MLRGDWRTIIAAAGLALLVGDVFAQPAVQNQVTQSNSQQRQAQPTQPPQPVIPPTVQADIKRIAEALEAQNAKSDPAAEKRNERDVNAQEDMVGWSKVMAKIVSAEAIITFIGVVLVGFTLAATRRAAKAAETTVDEMRAASRRELRAYLGVDRIHLSANSMAYYRRVDYVPKDRSKPGVRCDDFICVTVKNFGQTPASGVLVYCYFMALAPHSRPLPENFVSRDTDVLDKSVVRTSTSRFLLQSGQSHTTRVPLWDLTDVMDAADKRKSIFWYGRIYYQDAFGKPWRTKFCFEWQPDASENAFEFVPFEEYNGEDDKPAPT